MDKQQTTPKDGPAYEDVVVTCPICKGKGYRIVASTEPVTTPQTPEPRTSTHTERTDP